MSEAGILGKSEAEGRGVEARVDDGWNGTKSADAGVRFPAPSPLERRFSTPGVDPLEAVETERRRSVITNPDGSTVFEMDQVEVPRGWSQLATDIVASKYFRKAGVPGEPGREQSVKQLIRRIVGTIRAAGEELGGYFRDEEEADTFEAELTALLVEQRAAFNSPVWFNCGLHRAYGIEGSGGNFAWDPESDTFVETRNAYERPQCSACFIQSVDDDLMSIFRLVKNEARLFKYGSGTGTNFSALRGNVEKLSGGGTSSGLMSFLEVFDRAAGATKSGGTTRRAAKMVCLDMDHPEIVDFIEWKVREEEKARVLISEGGLSADFNGEAYKTVSGQNSNNSVRVTDEFMDAVDADGKWRTVARTTGEVCDTHRARDLMDRISESAWRCADPGVQFDTTINRWHTCKRSGRINASNPCSEYMFVDDSACNLASINLVKFLDDDDRFDVEGFRQAIRVLITAQEILVDLSSYPTEEIARNSHDFRPLGLGYANLGTLLMVLGVPYDSERGRALCGSLTAILTGHAYRVSAEIAARKGPFPAYPENADSMLEVMRMHRDAVDEIAAIGPDDLLAAARNDWDEAVAYGEAHGYRNAQASVLAPTGTIGLLMDCDTTGIEPDFALVKFKKLAGGGYFKIVNQSVPRALRRLGYTDDQITDIDRYVRGTMTLEDGPAIDTETLRERGLDEFDLGRIDDALSGAFDLESAINPWVLGETTMERLGIPRARWEAPGYSLLQDMGFSTATIETASEVVCGRMTIEGAPHIAEEHLAVFDCANRCGKRGKRFIEPTGHLAMMAAAQPFLSGAISKTVNLPAETTAEEIGDLYRLGWKLGLKAIAIYRDGCKMSQPLSTSGDAEKSEAPGTPEPESESAAASVPAPPPLGAPVIHRERLPRTRTGYTHEARVGGHKVYLRTGEYEDGRLGEIFIDMHKEGAAFRSMMNCFAISVSLGLQYGVPLDEFVDVFTFTRFEPHGHTDHPNVRFSTSVVDFIFRVLAMEYLGRHELVQVPPSEVDRVERRTSPGPAENRVEVEEDTVADEVARSVEPAAPVRAVGNGAGRGGVSEQLSMVSKDAPFCDMCGHLTVRNGACYKCLNCGQSVGCS